MCRVLKRYRVFEWPLAKDGRRHVHTQIDSAALPVRYQARRQGRPYTLVLAKTGELFTREKDARHKAVTDLAWLTSAWVAVAGNVLTFWAIHSSLLHFKKSEVGWPGGIAPRPPTELR